MIACMQIGGAMTDGMKSLVRKVFAGAMEIDCLLGLTWGEYPGGRGCFEFEYGTLDFSFQVRVMVEEIDLLDDDNLDAAALLILEEFSEITMASMDRASQAHLAAKAIMEAEGVQ